MYCFHNFYMESVDMQVNKSIYITFFNYSICQIWITYCYVTFLSIPASEQIKFHLTIPWLARIILFQLQTKHYFWLEKFTTLSSLLSALLLFLAKCYLFSISYLQEKTLYSGGWTLQVWTTLCKESLSISKSADNCMIAKSKVFVTSNKLLHKLTHVVKWYILDNIP